MTSTIGSNCGMKTPCGFSRIHNLFVTRFFFPLGYGVRLRIYKLKIKLWAMRMKNYRRRNL
jgi:hypothetical protein